MGSTTMRNGKSSASGGDLIARHHDATVSRRDMPVFQDILVVEDNPIDAGRLPATVRIIVGRGTEIRTAATLAAALDCVLEETPDLVFLDDYLKPNDTALQTIPFLRRAGFAGPIVVVSGALTRERRSQLIAVGAFEAVHKDDVDSARLAEVLASLPIGS